MSETVQRMVTMHTLYEHTDYESRLDYDGVQAESKDDGADFAMYWRDHKEQVEEEALAHLDEVTVKGGAAVRDAKVCSCGQKLLKHLL